MLARILLLALLISPLNAQMGQSIQSPSSDFQIQSQDQGNDGHGKRDQLGGCEDSPENPTLILAGIALAVGIVFRLKRSKV